MQISLSDGKFHHARELAIEARSIRAICAAFPEQFISSHQGFKLLRYASDTEIGLSSADLRSRAKAMTERADAQDLAMRTRSGQKELFSID